jgi:hypothetical protein
MGRTYAHTGASWGFWRAPGGPASLRVTVNDAFLEAKNLVEKVIRGLGLDPATTRVKSADDQAHWTLARGSASLLVTLVKTGQSLYVRVASPLMTLPEPGKQEALFRHLLELNAGGLGNAAFGLRADCVTALTERPVVGLDEAELGQMIRHLGALADTFDDRLVKEFGGALASAKT